jgi:glycosyltransferase involved in cell wall biosynthesis
VKLLVLSPFLYHSKVGHGGGVACIEQLQMLAQHHEIHFLAFVTRESEDELRLARAELDTLCQSITTVKLDISKMAVLRAKLKFLLRLTPVDAELFVSTAMQRQLQSQLASLRPDVVFVQFPQMAQYVDFCGEAASVIDVQDAFSISGFRKFRSQTAPLKKIGLFFNWISWLLYEMRHYKAFDAVAAVTDQDRVGLEIFSPGLGADVIKAAIAVDAELAPVAPVADTIGFIGSFSHYPNVEGVRYFIEQVLPAILARRPTARFLVAGGNAPAHLLALASAHVEFLGFVPDSNEFMRANAVVVVPLLSGGGVKIKTLHAMACACPMVSSSIGVEETGVVDGEHALVADTPQLFAAQVLALLDDPQRARQLGQGARTLAGERFSWKAKAASMERVLNHAVQKRAARTPPTTR